MTDEGRAYLAEHAAELEKINEQIKNSAEPMGKSAVGDAVKAFGRTLFEQNAPGRPQRRAIGETEGDFGKGARRDRAALAPPCRRSLRAGIRTAIRGGGIAA